MSSINTASAGEAQSSNSFITSTSSPEITQDFIPEDDFVAINTTSATMSYAQAAAPHGKAQQQTLEEKMAPPAPEIEHTDSASTSSLIDVDTDSVHTVPSDFGSNSIQTDTQKARIEREEEQAKAKAEQLKKDFAEKEKAAKAKAKKAAGKIERNSDNPVFVGNAVAVVALSAGLGFGAYRKYAAGELTWKVVGAWTAVVGLFAAGDYYLSSYLVQNKYPAKK